ncbi:mechanosensitive ion channel-like protein [Albibacterium bauzanense]|uniref:Mechanosensitive ion channel-like protein n=2 Tax=Albibacterium bauzanense TaxID=653929 RepID=A0A4V6NF38_9SPHI|nr:mechanosensitive ion channel-like protein [Albibacterium bauzanense]
MIDFLTRLSDRTPDLIWNLSIILFSILIGVLIKNILVPIIRKYSSTDQNYSIIRSSIKHFRLTFTFFIPLLIFNALLPLMKIEALTRAGFQKTVEIALTVCFAIIFIRTIRIIEDYLYYRHDYTKADNLRERRLRTQIQFIRKLLVAIIVIITTAIILLSFDSMRKIGAGLLTGVGVGGIIIGFAAQKSLGNLLAGFQIAFTQPMRIDDVLIVEGEWGRVEEITLTYVVVNIWDKRRLILPIQYFIETPFQNWTRTTAEILGTVFIYTDFTISVGHLREELSRLLKGNSLWDGKVNVLQVTDFKTDVMEIRCLMSCRNSGDAFDLRCYVRENMIDFIKNNYPESLSQTRVVLKNTNS